MIIELTPMVLVSIAAGGAAGAVLRLLLDMYLPFGVLAANVLGSLALGWLFGAAHEVVAEDTATVLAVGFIGTLSTFATVSLRAAQLWMDGRWAKSLGLWVAHVVCGLGAALAGIWLATL